MIKEITILFVRGSQSPNSNFIANEEFSKYLSNIIFSIIENSFQQDREKIRKILFIHNCFIPNEIQLSKQWEENKYGIMIQHQINDLIASFVKKRKPRDIKQKDNIYIESTETPGDYLGDWKKQLQLYFESRLDFAIVNNIGQSSIEDMHSAFSENYAEKILEAYEKETELNSHIITINTYHDCETILKSTINGEPFGDLIIVRDGQDHCYSTIINRTFSDKKVNAESLTTISSEDTGAKYKTTNGFFFPKENRYVIKKNRTKGVTPNAIKKWSKLFVYSPSCFFAYGEKDDLSAEMKKISSLTKRFYPFIRIQRDKEDHNSFINIEKYSNALFDGDIIIHIISESYLTSFYCMRELVNTLFNKGILYEDDSPFGHSDFDNIVSHGIIPLIKSDAYNILFNERDVLLNAWNKNLEKNNKEKIYPQQDIEKITKNINRVKVVLNKIYSFKSLEKFSEENYVTLIFSLNKALIQKGSDYSYPNIYHSYSLEYFKEIFNEIIENETDI